MAVVGAFTGGNDGGTSTANPQPSLAISGAGSPSVGDIPACFSSNNTNAATATVAPSMTQDGTTNPTTTMTTVADTETGGLTSGQITTNTIAFSWSSAARGLSCGVLLTGRTATGRVIGTPNSATTGTSLTVPSISSVPAGSDIVVCVKARNAQTTPPTISTATMTGAGYAVKKAAATAYPASPNFASTIFTLENVSAGSYGGQVITLGNTPVASSVYIIAFPSASTAATATGSITLSGAAAGVASIGASGSVSLTGSASGVGATGASGSMSLSGSASSAGVAAAVGSISMSGTSGWTAVAVGSLSLSGSAGAAGSAGASGSISLSGSATAGATAGATGSLTLSGAATAGAAAVATGSLTLSGTATARAAAAASGSITLSGSASSAGVAAAVGTISMSGTGVGAGPGAATASGSLSLSGTSTAGAAGAATGVLALSGTANGRAVAAATGTITLTGLGAGSGAASATGSITLVGAGSAKASITASGGVALAGVAGAGGASSAASGTIVLSGAGTAVAGGTLHFYVILENDVTDAVVALMRAQLPTEIEAYDHFAPREGRVFPYVIVYRIQGGDSYGPPLWDPNADLNLVYQIDAVGERRDQAEFVGSLVAQIMIGTSNGSPLYQLNLPPEISECGRLRHDVPGGVDVEGDPPHEVFTLPGRYEVCVTPTT